SEGREQDALKELAQVKLHQLDIGLAAPMALALAPRLATQDWQLAANMLENVVLRSPGTLMEESALRRLALIYLARDETKRAFAPFSRHIRRFQNSIFAEQAHKSFAAELASRPDQGATWALIQSNFRSMAPDIATRLYLEISESSLRKG